YSLAYEPLFITNFFIFYQAKDGIRDRNVTGVQTCALPISDCRVVGGMEGLIELAVMEETDILVTAIVGMIGIRPTIEAICARKDIALANKETLVTAGHIIMPLAEKKGVKIYPVDSEHSAIYQCLHGEKSESIQKLLITASGGPFRGKKRDEL